MAERVEKRHDSEIRSEEDVKAEEHAPNRSAGWLISSGAFDQEDQLYMRLRDADRKEAEMSLRQTEQALYAKAKNRFSKTADQVAAEKQAELRRSLQDEKPRSRPGLRGVKRASSKAAKSDRHGAPKHARTDTNVDSNQVHCLHLMSSRAVVAGEQ